ncbi:MAG: hypothetical protein EPN75_08655 [Beijerinckiaceae bacterium]|nr:MAG: hypothetical protein EPN75_08655 [Beijerinckiaceae bacterium]
MDTSQKPTVNLDEGQAAIFKQQNGTWTGFLKLEGHIFPVQLTEETISEKQYFRLRGTCPETGDTIVALPRLYQKSPSLSEKTQKPRPDVLGRVMTINSKAERYFAGWFAKTKKSGTPCISCRLSPLPTPAPATQN